MDPTMNFPLHENGQMTDDMKALRNYVTAKDDINYEEVSDSIVCLHIVHSNLKLRMNEIRLDLHSSIADVKFKIYRHCGTKPEYMELYLKNYIDGDIIVALNDDKRPLGYYSPQHQMVIYVQDNDPFSLAKNGGLEDTSLVKKYMITEEDYNKREKSVRAYKKEQLAKDPNWKPTCFKNKDKKINNIYDPSKDAELIKSMKLNDRCEIQPGGRRGKISYIGKVPELAPVGILDDSYWIGVVFDEPVGKSNGVVKGKRYFQCQPKFGGFIRPGNVTVGDFSELDPFSDSETDSET